MEEDSSQVHLKINEKFFQTPMDPKDERVERSLKFLEKNDFIVDYKKIRRAFENKLWRQDLKEAMDMKRFVQENLNKNMME